MEFGYRMRQLRNEKGLGLREFAKLINVSASYLSNIERGSAAPPTSEIVKIIAEGLDADVDELLQLANRFDMKELEKVRKNSRRLDTAERTINFLSSAMKLEEDDRLGGFSGILELLTGEYTLNPTEKFMGNSFKTLKFVLEFASKPDEGNNRLAIEIRREVGQLVLDNLNGMAYPSEDVEERQTTDKELMKIFAKYPHELCEEVIKNEDIRRLYFSALERETGNSE